jgi:enolase
MQIRSIKARQILDSRGNPTVECDVELDDGSFGRSAVPSGASTGSNEAHELRDNDKSKYGGKSVTKAVNNVNTLIADKLVNSSIQVDDQWGLDNLLKELDGTEDKSNLGANAILSVSLATARAVSDSLKLPLFKYIQQMTNTPEVGLPVPMVNILNGGAHTNWQSTDIQEFMIMPSGATFAERLEKASNVFHELAAVLKEKNLVTLVGDEGGYAPHLSNNSEALDVILEAISRAGYVPSQDINLALDVAASELYQDDIYHLRSESRQLNSDQFIDWLKDLKQKYPIVSIEDGLDESDWAGWIKMNDQMGHDTVLVGDDLLVTNTKFLRRAIDEKACNSILIKPNQIGTLSETLEAIMMAKKNNFRAIVSHRSGETEDMFISHLVVGCNTGYIKTGSTSRGERTAKYNELLRIEEMLR